MRIRFTGRQYRQGEYRVWDGDNGRWASLSYARLAEAEQEADRMSRAFWEEVEEQSARQRGTAISLYFASMTKEQVGAMRERLNGIAAEHGLVAQAGPTARQGSVAGLLAAIADGTLVVTALDGVGDRA